MKADQAFKVITKAIGFKLTPEQEAELEKAKEIDLPTDLDPVIDWMANTGAQQVKVVMRKEAWDAADKALKEVVDSIEDPELKAELLETMKKDGVPTKVREFSSKMAAKTKALKEAKKDGDSDKVSKLETELSKLQGQVKTYAEKETAWEADKKKADKVDQYEKRLVSNEIATRALSHKGISDDRKKERRFRENFMADVEDILSKEGVYIDPDTLKILKKDTDQILIKNGADFTLETLLGEVAEHEDWKKKSNPAGGENLPIDDKGEVDKATLAAAAALLE